MKNAVFTIEIEKEYEQIKAKEIEKYNGLCQCFEVIPTIELSKRCDEQAKRLHDKFNLSWDEIKNIEENIIKFDYDENLDDLKIWK